MKIVIYVRVSTQEQALEGYSIAAQISVLKAYAISLGYTIVYIYEDQGISGKNIKDRPGLLQLIEDAKQKKFDSVLVWKLSRLSRSLLDLLSIVDIFTQCNISFQSYSEKFDTSTPIGKMLLQLLGSIAEFERNTIIENVKLGLNERFKQGYSKGAIPFGYKPENKKAVIVPDQADAVRYVFNHYLEYPNKDGAQRIADYLNLNGYKTRTGGTWNRHNIKDMLKNIFYAGYVRTGIHAHGYKMKDNAAEIPGQHEPIISMDLYNAVKQKLDSNKQPALRNPDNDSVLSGLVVCPLCGSKMFALNTYNKYIKKNGEEVRREVRIYRCTSKDKGTCKGFYISGNKVEPQALKKLFSIKDSEVFGMIVERANKKSKKASKPIIDKVSLINKEIEKWKKQKDKYQRLFEELENPDYKYYAERMNEIYTKISELEKAKEQELLNIPEEVKDIDITAFVKNIIGMEPVYNKLPNDKKKDWIRSLVKEVHISLEKTVTYIQLINNIKI